MDALGHEGISEKSAVVHDTVDGLVAAAEQHNPSFRRHWFLRLPCAAQHLISACTEFQLYFSTTKLPITSASRPELKNVRIASVGVQTIGSPRRLNDVFITTGTPVRWPNS